MIVVKENASKLDMGVVKEGRYLLVPSFTLYVILYLYLPLLPHSVHCQCTKNPIIFNFGDSNSDTGGYADGVGLNFSPPNGRTYFHQPARRLSDGRLMIDFLCKFTFAFSTITRSLILKTKDQHMALEKYGNS